MIIVNQNNSARPRSRNAFTVIELLVALSVIALLIAILLPALSAGRHAARDLRCKANLRSVATEFSVFADAGNNVNRGQSDNGGTDRFEIEDFQESIYRVAEFWPGGDLERQSLSDSSLTMVCPSGPARALTRRAGIPCSEGAVGPAAGISVGFNMRLHRRSTDIDGVQYLRTARLSPKILAFPDVPLVFDVGGEAADLAGHTPYYSAPAVMDDKVADAYESGNHWFPALRHRNKMNVAFVGGHVLSSANVTAEPLWRWSYQPEF